MIRNDKEPAVTGMNKARILSLLNQHREQFKKRFAVKHLSLFGSAARDEMREGSDIDVLVEFDGPATFDAYIGLKTELEALFHAKVDLATEAMIKPRLRKYIEKDLVRVA
jgi:predicted nucleotidyltransferase